MNTQFKLGTRVRIPKTADVAPCLFGATGVVSNTCEDKASGKKLYVVTFDKQVSPGGHSGELRSIGVPSDCLRRVR